MASTTEQESGHAAGRPAIDEQRAAVGSPQGQPIDAVSGGSNDTQPTPTPEDLAAAASDEIAVAQAYDEFNDAERFGGGFAGGASLSREFVAEQVRSERQIASGDVESVTTGEFWYVNVPRGKRF